MTILGHVKITANLSELDNASSGLYVSYLFVRWCERSIKADIITPIITYHVM